MASTRAHPRYALEVDAEVRLPERTIPARTQDVSKGGLCMGLHEPLALGTEMWLNLALVFDEETFSEPLLVRARVVWCTHLSDRHQIGVSYIGMTTEQRSYLDMFLRYLTEGKRRAAMEDSANDDGGSGNDENPFG